MIFSTAFIRPLACSKVGDLLSGGWTRGAETPTPTKTLDIPKTGDAASSKSGPGNEQLDQKFIDSKVGDFEGAGHASGSRQSGETSDANTLESAGLAEYRAAQQKKWQVQQDAAARDKLFGQPTSGRVDGKDVDPFSSETLEGNAKALVGAEKAKKERAVVLKRKDIAKVSAITAAITAPLTVVGAVVSGTVNEVLKPVINPSALPATAQSVEDGRLVDHIQKNVFLLANTLADLRLEPHVAPSVKWVAQTNDERMDSLEDMLDYIEPEFAKEAQQRGIAFEPASTGEQHDDIKGRAIAVESRMAALTALMGRMTSRLDVTAA